MIKFCVKNKKILNILVIILVISTSILAVPTCRADVSTAAIEVIGVFAQMIVYVCGLFLTSIIKLIIAISEYNNFINEKSIVEAWGIIRDVCNMFFILILLVIAFATILRIESYNMKKWLPKLLIMAVLINFSRMICGILIDVSQIFFLIFVKSFSGNGSGLFTMFNVSDMVSNVKGMDPETLKKAGGFSKAAGAIIAGLIFMVIATIVLLAVLIAVVMRIVMFWIYTVLSPLAFLLSSFPGGQKYASQYWGEFTRYLVNGPVLVFFVWLALISTNGTATSGYKIDIAGNNDIAKVMESSPNGTAIFTGDVLLSYVIAIGMLVGGLMVSSQIGGIGSSVGNSMLGKVKGKTVGALKFGAGAAVGMTGYNYVKDTAKNYLATRKSTRDNRVRLTSEKVAQTIGNKKDKYIAKPLKQIGDKFKNTVPLLNKNGKAAKEADAKVKTLKKDYDEKKDKVRNKRGFKHKDVAGNETDYKWDKEYKQWEANNGSSSIFIDEDAVYEDLENDYEPQIEAGKERAHNHRQTQAKWDGRMKNIVGVASLGILPKIGGKLKNAGKQDLGAASNYNLKQVTDKKDKMKEDSDDKVLNTMNDMTKSSYERVAAAMEAMTRKIVDLSDAKLQKKVISDTFKGDKKISGRVEAILAKNYAGATTKFGDLHHKDIASTDTKEQAAAVDRRNAAHRSIRSGYEDGTYSIKALDAKSIHASIREAALGVKTGAFVKQYKDFDSAKQASVLRSLKSVKGAGEYEAKEKIAHIKDINVAFGGDTTMTNKFVEKLTATDIKKIIEDGNKDKLKALKDYVKREDQLSESVRTAIASKSSTGKMIKEALKV